MSYHRNYQGSNVFLVFNCETSTKRTKKCKFVFVVTWSRTHVVVSRQFCFEMCLVWLNHLDGVAGPCCRFLAILVLKYVWFGWITLTVQQTHVVGSRQFYFSKMFGLVKSPWRCSGPPALRCRSTRTGCWSCHPAGCTYPQDTFTCGISCTHKNISISIARYLSKQD